MLNGMFNIRISTIAIIYILMNIIAHHGGKLVRIINHDAQYHIQFGQLSLATKTQIKQTKDGFILTISSREKP